MVTSDRRFQHCVLTRRLSAFKPLLGGDAAAVDRACTGTVRTAAAKRDLVREGDRPRVVYLVLSGWAARYKTLQDGRRQLVAFLVPGDMCDLNNTLLDHMDHSIGALTSVDYIELHHDDIHRVADAHPNVAQALWWQLLVSMAVEREWIVNLGQRTAIERLGHLFCELCYRLKSVGLASDARYHFPITQIDLAEATGLTPVHVNRTIQEMRSMGLIVLKERMLEILDLRTLEDMVLFNRDYLHLGRDGRRLQPPRPQLRISE
jgi:CRP-like cAMP-binding protein